MPLISVCIAAYNVEKYIAQCLESVLNQNFDDYEIYLVDNGSEDRTVELCESYARRYPDKIKFEKMPRPTIFGRAASRAMNKATGEYIVLMDSDDYIAPGCLSAVAAVIKEKGPDLIMIDYDCVAEAGLVPRKGPVFDAKMINDVPYSEAIKYITSLEKFLPFTWMYFRKADTIHSRFDEEKAGLINGDAFGVLGIYMESNSICFIDSKFYTYRLRHNSVSTTAKSITSAKGLFLAVVKCIALIGFESEVFNKEERLEVIYMFLVRYLKIAIGNYSILDYESLREISAEFDRVTGIMSVFKNHDCALLSNIYHFMNQYGTFKGLIMFCEFEKAQLLECVDQIANKKLYIMPTGSYGESAAEILSAYGIAVVSFLDNSEQKEGQVFENIPCHLPSCLKNESDLDNVAVVVATVYETHINSMKDQLVTLGVSEANIIVRGDVSA